MKKRYYHFMYEASDLIMWLVPNDNDHFVRWWNISEDWRAKRDAVA